MLNKFSVKRLGLLVVVAAGLSAVSSAAPAVGQISSSDACSTADQLTPAINLATTIKQFVQEMPAGDSNGYRNPLSDLNARNALVEGFNKVRTGDLIGACGALGPAGYSVRRTTDNATRRQLALLQENKVNGSVPRAWGLYVIAWPPNANSSTLSVQVPHACPNMKTNGCNGGDRLTHLVGIRVFRAADAHYLFVNGADRRANGVFGADACEGNSSCSDVAHQPESPFEKIHEAAIAPFGSNAKVYQSHRYLSTNHDGDADEPCAPLDNVTTQGNPTGSVANVVVSSGTTTPSQMAQNVASAVETAVASFFHVCLFNDPNLCSELGATRNVQKDYMERTFGGHFIHVEANESIVSTSCGNPCRRNQLAEAIAGVLQ